MKKFYIWLSITVTLNLSLFGSKEGQYQPLCFLSLKNSRKPKWKMCIFLCSAVSHSAARKLTLRPGCAVLVTLAVITLAPNQNTTQCFSCLCFSTCIFGDAEKCLCVVQRSLPCSAFPLTQLSSVSDDRFTSGMWLCIHICTAAAKENTKPLGLPEHTLPQLLY